MTATEWNEITDFLERAEADESVEYNGRSVTVVNMNGGRYLLEDENGDVSGLVHDAWKALTFLKTGKVFPIEGE